MSTDRMSAREKLAESLTGGEVIDWAQAEAAATNAEDRSWLRALRDLERMTEFHHTLQQGANDPIEAAGAERWGDLLLLERWGSGAHADVYRAWDTRLQREVALKLLRARDDGADANAALAEARALARVRDPHVVQIHDVATHDGRAGIEMEFLRGETLEQCIARGGPLPAADVARVGTQIAQALAAAHAARVVHGDVKPANIALEPQGRAVLTDFGVGRRSEQSATGSPFGGTPMLMSPQRLLGATATAADDVYALGVTLHWALGGRAPFAAETLEALRESARRGDVLRLSAALTAKSPPALVATIARAMAPEAGARFESAAAFAEALAAAAVAPAPGAGSGVQAAQSQRRRQTIGWAAVVLIAVFASSLLIKPHAKVVAPAPKASLTPAPAAAGAYDLSATLLKRGKQADVRLAEGDRVGPGDDLTLEFRGSAPLYVYVLDADDRGESYLLFPQPMFDQKNPLPADASVMLPGTRGGHENAWTVTSRGGHEHFLIVASPTPVAELEGDVAKLSAPVPGKPITYARVGAASIERLRGVGGVSEAPGEPAHLRRPSATFEKIRALAGREQSVRGVWVRQVTLKNPLR